LAASLACKLILVPFILAVLNHTVLRHHTVPVKVGILLVFVPFNLEDLFRYTKHWGFYSV